MFHALGCQLHTATYGLHGCQDVWTPQVSVSPTYVKWGRSVNPATLPVRSGCQVNGRAWNPAVSCCPSCSCSQDERTQPLCLSNQLELTSYPSGPFVFPSALLLVPYSQPLCILQSGGGLSLLSYLHPINIRQVAIPRQAVHQAQDLDPGERRVCILLTSK